MNAILIKLAECSLYLTGFATATCVLFRFGWFRDPAIRHLTLSCVSAVSLLMIVTPRLEWNNALHRSTDSSRTTRVALQPAHQVRPEASGAVAISGVPEEQAFKDVLPAFFVWSYFGGAAIFAARLLVGVRGLCRAADPAGVLRTSIIAMSKQTAIPMVSGVIRHRIVVPVQWQEWSRFKRRSVVAHEAAHIRRRDVELTLLRKVVVCVYWFHPVSWWLDRESAKYAEHAADDAASARVGDRVRYSRILVEVASTASSRRSSPLLAMARPSTIMVRVARLLTESGSIPVPRSLWFAVPTVCVICTFVAAAFPVLPGARAGASISLGMFFQRQLTGKLAAELVVNPTGGQAEDLTEATPQLRGQLSGTVDAADTLWQGWTSIPQGRKLNLVVLEPASKASQPVLYADLNFDGQFSAAERFKFQATADDPDAAGDVILHVPLQDQPFQKYPVRLRLPRPGTEPFGRKALIRTPFAYVSGTVNIDGKPVLLWVQYDPKRGGAFSDYGWQGMDVDQDGRIRTGANSPEYTFARDERVIFNVNGRELSISNVDLVNRTISLREHPSGSNQRILLRKGSFVPDFSFRDLVGGEHKLSDFRGKYVLLDFWGTWCPPCIKLLPELQAVHQQFRDRGLIVLGLPSHEENPETPRLVLEKHGVTFLQAEADSVKDVVEKQFRINAFPTHILIDMNGRIIEDGEALRPPNLSPLLDRTLRKE